MQDIDASQSGRWSHWQAAAFAIPRREIEIQGANMHLIPADGTVGDVPDGVRRGQIVELRGYLVRAGADDGRRWIGPLARENHGAHACGLVYVERAGIVE